MKTELITGASQGLGRALMQELTRRGLRVVGVARGAEALEAVVAEVRAAGGEAHGIVEDVARTEAAARIAGEASALVGPIDVVIHNAASLGPVPLRPLSELDDGAFDAVVQVNLAGPFRLTRLLVGGMALRGEGAVVFISSDAAVEAYPTWGVYGATKAAADQLARIWAAELPSLRFLSFDPGEMNTAMHAAAMPEADPDTLQSPADVARRLADTLGLPVDLTPPLPDSLEAS